MPVPFIPEVRVEIDGRVCGDEMGGVWGPLAVASQGR